MMGEFSNNVAVQNPSNVLISPDAGTWAGIEGGVSVWGAVIPKTKFTHWISSEVFFICANIIILD